MSTAPFFRIVNGLEVVSYLLKSLPYLTREDLRVIGLEKDGRIVAATGYTGWTGGACQMHIAAEEVTRPFLRASFDYPFGQLGLSAALGLVDERNEKALDFDRRIGFREVYRVKGGAGGADLIILEMRPEWCKWRNHE